MKLRSIVFAGLLFVTLPFASSFAQVGISVNFAPPVLPVYEQPPCPVAGYIWTPGYWAWDSYYYDYYWVPGVWVPPPRVGLLWTPPWWGWSNGAYVFNQGYWGPTVGFYGGINYGYGYTGSGYWGGRWSGNTFQYNTAVTRVNTNIVHNTYVNNSFTKNVNANRASFNGPNGVNAQETAAQKAAAANAKKVGPTSQQLTRQQAASKDNNLKASVSKGNPNANAIKSFNSGEPAGQGKGGAQGLGTAGGATRAGAGKGGNKPGSVSERNLQGAGNAAAHGNKLKTLDQQNKRNIGGNQAKMHTGNMAGQQGFGPGQHAMNQQMRHRQQIGGQHQQKIGAQHQQPKMKAQPHPKMQGGGNRLHPGGQQQGKKKEGKH